MKSTVSSKGQITIPLAIRQALGLRAGTVVTFEPRDDGALLRRATAGRHPVDLVFGAARRGAATRRAGR